MSLNNYSGTVNNNPGNGRFPPGINNVTSNSRDEVSATLKIKNADVKKEWDAYWNRFLIITGRTKDPLYMAKARKEPYRPYCLIFEELCQKMFVNIKAKDDKRNPRKYTNAEQIDVEVLATIMRIIKRYDSKNDNFKEIRKMFPESVQKIPNFYSLLGRLIKYADYIVDMHKPLPNELLSYAKDLNTPSENTTQLNPGAADNNVAIAKTSPVKYAQPYVAPEVRHVIDGNNGVFPARKDDEINEDDIESETDEKDLLWWQRD